MKEKKNKTITLKELFDLFLKKYHKIKKKKIKIHIYNRLTALLEIFAKKAKPQRLKDIKDKAEDKWAYKDTSDLKSLILTDIERLLELKMIKKIDTNNSKRCYKLLYPVSPIPFSSHAPVVPPELETIVEQQKELIELRWIIQVHNYPRLSLSVNNLLLEIRKHIEELKIELPEIYSPTVKEIISHVEILDKIYLNYFKKNDISSKEEIIFNKLNEAMTDLYKYRINQGGKI